MYFKILIILLSAYYELIKNTHIKTQQQKSVTFSSTPSILQRCIQNNQVSHHPIQVLFKSYSSPIQVLSIIGDAILGTIILI